MAIVSIPNWDGTSLEGVTSRSGSVFAAIDWRDMILGQPAEPILRKAADAASSDAFAKEDLPHLARVLGHYTQLQSINSEDTVTWCLFSSPAAHEFLFALVARAFGRASGSGPITATIWGRTPHPDTGRVEHGPEADVLMTRPGCYYAIEAKWTADIDPRQGKNHDMSQIDMRCSTVRKACEAADSRGVLVVAPGPRRYPHAHRSDSCFRRYFTPAGDAYVATSAAIEAEARAITWESISQGLRADPLLSEVHRYLEWRLDHLAEK